LRALDATLNSTPSSTIGFSRSVISRQPSAALYSCTGSPRSAVLTWSTVVTPSSRSARAITSNTTGFWCGAVMIRISSSGATSSAIRPYLRRASDRASGSSASTSSVRSCRKYAGYRGAGKSKPSIFGSGGLGQI
jgi:hypothetical protein